MRPIILVDMDNVLSNFDEMLTRTAEERGVITTGIASEKDLLATNEKSEDKFQVVKELLWQCEGFWSQMRPLRSGFYLVNRLIREFRIAQLQPKVIVVTRSPVNCPGAWGEKVTWFKKHSSILALSDIELACVSGSKSHFKGDILIEANAGNMRDWLKEWSEGIALYPAYDQLKDFKHERAYSYMPVAYRDPNWLTSVCDKVIDIYKRTGG